mmetsp:Transcript_32047/g.53842  ORF Transcript_32047/g.53842 Transcript_32047/m.53842 type:complete len:272 (-) Transcript_32047:450-1265(-)
MAQTGLAARCDEEPNPRRLEPEAVCRRRLRSHRGQEKPGEPRARGLHRGHQGRAHVGALPIPRRGPPLPARRRRQTAVRHVRHRQQLRRAPEFTPGQRDRRQRCRVPDKLRSDRNVRGPRRHEDHLRCVEPSQRARPDGSAIAHVLTLSRAAPSLDAEPNHVKLVHHHPLRDGKLGRVAVSLPPPSPEALPAIRGLAFAGLHGFGGGCMAEHLSGGRDQGRGVLGDEAAHGARPGAARVQGGQGWQAHATQGHRSTFHFIEAGLCGSVQAD